MSRSSRASSSAVNLNRASSAAAWERRRLWSQSASPPPASASGGNSHSTSVCGLNRGLSSTNSPYRATRKSITCELLSPAAIRSRTSSRRSRASGASESSIDWFWHTMQRNSRDRSRARASLSGSVMISSGCTA